MKQVLDPVRFDLLFQQPALPAPLPRKNQMVLENNNVPSSPNRFAQEDGMKPYVISDILSVEIKNDSNSRSWPKDFRSSAIKSL